ELPDMENLEAIINEATKQYKAYTYSVPVPDHKPGKNFKKYEYKIEVRNPDNVNVIIPDIPNVDSIINIEMEHLENLNWDGAFPDDSLSMFNFFKYDDSTNSSNPRNFNFRMKEFEEEMKKFREEMEKLKKEVRKDSVKVKPKKPVEI
ncbi:MAG TPA: hypothetical protein VLN45_12925, partial [Ignavibacteriaceae bacterium]|nr:hypothetical protein [Ignavibacteriaceae bacterium]